MHSHSRTYPRTHVGVRRPRAVVVRHYVIVEVHGAVVVGAVTILIVAHVLRVHAVRGNLNVNLVICLLDVAAVTHAC